MFRRRVCQFLHLDCYLSNDLAVFSMDLSDAASLCQEGKDLVELWDKRTATVKLQWLFPVYTRLRHSFF